MSSIVRQVTTWGPVPGQNAMAANGASPLELSLTLVAAVVECLAFGTASITQGSQSKEGVATLYTEYQVAVIKGYCGLHDTAAIPVIWTLF